MGEPVPFGQALYSARRNQVKETFRDSRSRTAVRVAHQVHLRRSEAGGVRRAGVEPPGGTDTTAAGKCRSAARCPRRIGTRPRPPGPGGAPPGSRLNEGGPGNEQSKLLSPSSLGSGCPDPRGLLPRTRESRPLARFPPQTQKSGPAPLTGLLHSFHHDDSVDSLTSAAPLGGPLSGRGRLIGGPWRSRGTRNPG